MGNKKEPKKLETPRSLKIICILSFLGFALAMSIDSANYLSYSSIDTLKTAADQTGWEVMEDKLELLDQNGIDVSENGTMRISLMYIYRSIIDVLALLGVSMMFVRLKLGFVIYSVFQFAYAAIPIVMFGTAGALIVGYGSIAITLVYIGLFLTQKRHLIR